MDATENNMVQFATRIPQPLKDALEREAERRGFKRVAELTRQVLVLGLKESRGLPGMTELATEDLSDDLAEMLRGSTDGRVGGFHPVSGEHDVNGGEVIPNTGDARTVA